MTSLPAPEGGERPLVSATNLIGCVVANRNGEEIGRLADLVVRWDGDVYPALAGLVVRVGRRRTFVHANEVERLEPGRVELGSARVVLEEYQRREGEVLLAADLLDHQLVDVNGARVVRAADLYLAQLGTGTRLVAVDVGLKALARRMVPGGRHRGRVAKPDAVIDFAEVQPFGATEGKVRLRDPGRRLRKLRPDQLADLLDDLGRSERSALIAELDAAMAADVLEEAHPSWAAELLAEAPPSRAAEMLLAMEPDEAAEALREVDAEDRARILAGLDAEVRELLDALVRLPAGTAGGHMTSRLVMAHIDDTVGAVRERLRSDPATAGGLDAIVVVDDGGALLDDITVLELLLAEPDAVLATLTGPPFPIVVHVSASLEEVVDRFIDQRGSSIVVVDDDRRPIGRIHADDLIDALVPELDRHERRERFRS